MSHKNSYDFVRFIAAGCVVFSHSFALVALAEPRIGSASLGAIGVSIFFILSGYLISASWKHYPRFNVFFFKRMLRIFPGLITSVLLTIIVCGVFFSDMPVVQFFSNQETISYLNNIFLINTQYSLPGNVFAQNPYPNAINGSIWTLAYEFLMYLSVAFIGAFGLHKKNGIEKIWLFLFVMQLLISTIGVSRFDFFVLYFQFNYIITLGFMFFTGVIVERHIKKIYFLPVYGLLSLIVFVALASLLPMYTELFCATFLAYAIFSLGGSDKLSKFGRYGDFSYGIYIYSFPIQQMLVATTQTTQPYKLFVLSFGISIVFGALSWWLVESRVLKYKSKINVERYPVLKSEAV